MGQSRFVEMGRQGFAARGQLAANAASRRRTDSWESVDGFTLVGCGASGSRRLASHEPRNGAMDTAVGRSVEVDGAEWIDLGPPPPPAVPYKGSVSSDGEHVAECLPAQLSAALKTERTAARPSAASKMESRRPDVNDNDPIVIPDDQTERQQVEDAGIEPPTPAVPAPMSKADRSKEALKAFYLGRAKQIEAKRKQILVAPTQPVTIRPLREPGRSAFFGN